MKYLLYSVHNIISFFKECNLDIGLPIHYNSYNSHNMLVGNKRVDVFTLIMVKVIKNDLLVPH
jgi:hypothetical protein